MKEEECPDCGYVMDFAPTIGFYCGNDKCPSRERIRREALEMVCKYSLSEARKVVKEAEE